MYNGTEAVPLCNGTCPSGKELAIYQVLEPLSNGTEAVPLNNGTCGIIWPQSAHDPDAAWNAAMALCVDHLQRRGKRKDWVRYELHWNYLYSNKNCAMVQSAWMGMIWPLFLCFSLVGFLFFAYSLLTIAPTFGDQFAYQTVSSLLIIQAWYNLRHYGAKTKLLTINLGIQIKWIFDWCFCLAPAAFAICGIVLLVAWGIAIYNFVRSLLCFTKYAGLVAFEVITSTAINTVCFLWTPITTTISVVCPYAIVFVSRYRDFLGKLLDFASPTVRGHYAASISPSWLLTFSNVCQPCDGGSMDMSNISRCSYHPFPCRNALRPNTNERPGGKEFTELEARAMPWRIWVYRNLHLAFSLYDDALATVYARLLHLHVWATLRCLQYRSGEYIVLYVCNFGLIMTRKALYYFIGFATIWQIVYMLTNSIAVAADPQDTTPVFDGQRDSFVAWYMLFTGYVAWKATDAYTIADGSETKPEPPAGEEPDISAPTYGEEGAVTNQATITAETRARDAWRKRTKKVESWKERNRKLYGLLITAMPTWLRTSLFNSHSGDGRAAITYLQSTFNAGAGTGKGNDHGIMLITSSGSLGQSSSPVGRLTRRIYRVNTIGL